jgi:hypothetical protein
MAIDSDEIGQLEFADPTSFRNAAAGLIKSLIRARARQEPEFLRANDYQRWGVTDLQSERRSCTTLLRLFQQLRDQFEHRLIEGQNSIPEPSSSDDADLIDAVVDQIWGFVQGDINQAIRDAERGRQVQWNKLAAWSNLTELRDALDRLPSTPRRKVKTSPTGELPVIRRTPKAIIIEWKKNRQSVSDGTADAYEAMIKAKGQPVGIGKYVRKPNEWLETQKEAFPELASIVERADGNKGYRVTIFDADRGA